MAAMLALVPPAAPEVTMDSDRKAAARYLHHGLGWSALDAFHLGLDARLCAAILMLEAESP
jgi:hypothetical protein